MNALRPWLEDLWRWTTRLLPSVLLACLFFQFVGLAANLRPVLAPQGVVATLDHDAGELVRRTERSLLWGDGGWRRAGPLVSRVARVIRTFSPVIDERTPPASPDAPEEASHFALLLTSLAGLFLVSFGVATLATTDRRWRVLTTLFLVPIFLRHPTWGSDLVIAGPELLLAGFCVLGFVFVARWLERPEAVEGPRGAGLVWGVALATGLAALFPCLSVAALVSFWDRARWKLQLKRFLLMVLLGAFVAAFPQALDFVGIARALGDPSFIGSGFGLDSFLGWWSSWGSQLVGPASFVIAIAFFFGRTRTWSADRALGVLAVSQLGFLILSLRRFDDAHEQAVIPFAAFTLASLAWVVSHLAPPGRLRVAFARFPREVPLLIVFVYGLAAGSFASPDLRRTVASHLACRPTFAKVYAEISNRLDHGELLIGTPYTPLPARAGDQARVLWEMKAEDLGTTEAKFFVLNRNFIARFLTDKPSDQVMKSSPEWKLAREFFEPLERVSEIDDTAKRHWHRREGDLCGLEIWERK